MRLLFLISLILIGCAPNRSELEITLENFVKDLPEIKPGYHHDPVNEDPTTTSQADTAFFAKNFGQIGGAVGYWRTGAVTCVLTTAIGDDIYLILTTFVTGEKIDSQLLTNGGAGLIGCDVVDYKEELTLKSASIFESVENFVSQKCDSTDVPIPNTEKTTVTKTTTIVNPDGTISLATTNGY